VLPGGGGEQNVVSRVAKTFPEQLNVREKLVGGWRLSCGMLIARPYGDMNQMYARTVSGCGIRRIALFR
jgi:hypothetical protein